MGRAEDSVDAPARTGAASVCVAHIYVRACIWIGSIVILATITAGCGARPLHLGETRDEFGGERACGMTAHTKVHASEALEGEAPQVYAIELDAATCYRFFTVGAPEIDVLAAAVADTEGNVVAIDNSRDRAPILGPRASFCPSTGGRYRVVIAAVYGSGSYVMQVWSRPRTPDDR